MPDRDPDLVDSLQAAASRPRFNDNPAIDHLYDMVLRLTQELAVTREEVAALRTVLAESEQVIDDMVEKALTNPEFASAQLEQHRALVARVLGDLDR